MELGKNINPETKEVNFGYFTFETGKRIVISAEEVKEFEDKLKSAKAEGKLCSQTLTPKTHKREFFITGAYVQGVEYGNKKLLIVTNIDSDTFCDGSECNDRIEKEYDL